MSQKAPNFRRSVLARSVLLACGATATVLAMQPAFSQEANSQLQRVEITGSAIKRIDGETSVPVTVVKMDELVKQGVTTIEQVMAKLSIVQAQQGTSQVVGNGTGGASFADIRGLGSSKTLVLLNGRRVASNSIDGGSVDLNMIPFAAIQRVEVLRDGASALYGSDAIGGVINFITKTEYTGGSITLGIDKPTKDGAKANGFNIGGGFGSLEKDGFNIFGFVDVQRQDSLSGLQRPFNTRFPGGLSVNTFPGNYGQTEFAAGNWMNPAAPGCNANPSITPDTTNPTGCKEATSSFVDYAPKSERSSAFLKGTKTIDADTSLGLEYFYTRDKVESQIAPVPYYGLLMNRMRPDGTPNPFFPGNPGAIPYNSVHNAYDPNFMGLYGEVAGGKQPGGKTAAAPGFAYVNWRAIPGGPRADANTNTQQRFVASLDGVAAGWDYQAALTHNENTVQVSVSGYQDAALINEAMISGLINPFGDQSPAGLAAIAAASKAGSQQIAKATSNGIDAHASRELSDWFGAGRKVTVAVGGSYSRDSMYQIGDDMALNIALKPSTGFDPATNNSGSRNVSALFTEFNIPIVKSLEMTLAGRADSYSDFGTTFNPKIGMRYQPTQEVLIRASASTGFRAPSLYELYSTNTYTNTSNVTDRVTGKSSQFQRLTGGNPDLKPEKSQNATLGIVVEPVKNLTLSADFWAIQLKDVIGSLPDTTAFANDQFNPLFHRNANGQLSQGGSSCPGPTCGYVDLRTQNLGGTMTDGIDLAANYRMRLDGAGTVSFGMQSTFVDHFDYQDYQNGPWNQNVGVYSGTGPIFRWNHNANIDWSNDTFAVGLTGHYKSGYVDQNTSANIVAAGPVNSYVTYDMYGSWKVTKGLSLTAGVKNLFDQDPPLSYQVYVFQAGYDPRYTDPTGRAYYLRATYAY
jgi:iron complex outermembrane receptor protein